MFANGTPGRVEAVEKGGRVTINLGGRESVWPEKLISAFIVPAYAMTIHKAQGSEYDRGIVVVENMAGLQFRSSVYTGITRFKKECWLLGVRESMRAVVGSPQNPTFCDMMVDRLLLV